LGSEKFPDWWIPTEELSGTDSGADSTHLEEGITSPSYPQLMGWTEAHG
jgi:hypothetical protein